MSTNKKCARIKKVLNRSTRIGVMPKRKKRVKGRKEQVQSIAIDILEKNKSGLQFIDLVDKVKEGLNTSGISIPDNTVKTYVQLLAKDKADHVDKPDWGTFRFKETEKAAKPTERKYKEKETQKLYKAFADWLQNENECTKAVAVGGKRFGDKWSTPDVVGKYELSQRALLKSETVIVSAEIKATTNTIDIISGFGQACAYKVFSHKVYVVVPSNTDKDMLRKLESQCSILGIGLVVFDIAELAEPKPEMFARKVKAFSTTPDMYWSNEYMVRIESDLWPIS